MSPAVVPAATYRLQFNNAFTFDDARAVVDYLERLGISHCYASNYFKAVPGSSHGYDVADPTQLNPEIGTECDHAGWSDAIRARGMGHVMDLRPDHMGVAKSAHPGVPRVGENRPSARLARPFELHCRP